MGKGGKGKGKEEEMKKTMGGEGVGKVRERR